MSKYTRFDCYIFNKKLADLEISDNQMLSPLFIDLDTISGFRPDTDDEGLPNDDSIIYLSSGESFIIATDYKELYNIMEKHNANKTI